jgi:DNA polymerase-3 subunit gamma/tau
MTLRSLSFRQALGDLASLLQRIALAQTVPAAVPDEWVDAQAVRRFASLFSADDVQLYYQIAIHGRNDLGLAPDEATGFSMTLLRLLAFQPAQANYVAATASNAAAAAATKSAAASATGSTTAQAPSAAPAQALQVERARTQQPAKLPEMAATASSVPTAPQSPAPAMVALPVVEAPAPKHPERTEILQPTNAEIDWPALAAGLQVTGLARQLATQSELVSVRDGLYVIRTAARPLAQGGHVEKLRQALSDAVGQTVRLQVDVGAVRSETAQGRDDTAKAERQSAAEQAIQADPLVQTLMNEFDATIVPNSIRPA